MVGASVGQPGRQTGGLSVHLELSTDRALRQGCSGNQPASHTYTTFMLPATCLQRKIQTSTCTSTITESEMSLAIKCVVSSLQG